MGGSREEATAVLMWRLVECVLGDHRKGDTGGPTGSSAANPQVINKAYRYAMRIVSSRIAPSVMGDESSVGEAIRRSLTSAKSPSAALQFGELHRRLSNQPGLQGRYELLRLLQQIADDARSFSPTDNASVGGSILLQSSAMNGGLQNLDLKSSRDMSFSQSGSVSERAHRAGGHMRSSWETASSVPSTPYTDHGSQSARASVQSARASTQGGDMQMMPVPTMKAVAFREFGEVERVDFEVSEAALVQDLVYTCQGIDGQHIRYDPNADGYVVNSGVGVPRSARELLRRLCELGWLYRRVKAAVTGARQHGGRPGGGMHGSLAQAFTSALQQELGEYYRLMAVLEAQVGATTRHTPALTASGDSGSAVADPPVAFSPGQLTLRRLAVWLSEPITRMRCLAMCADAAQGKRGGQLATALHALTLHGDPFMRALTSKLTRQVCVPLFAVLGRWLFEGELQDPQSEFFVVADPSVEDEDLWWKKYRVQSQMVPPFISPTLANKILRTGKSINFLRHCCKDQGWAQVSATVSATTRGSLEYYGAEEEYIHATGGQAAGESGGPGGEGLLEAAVSEVARVMDRYLLERMFKEFRFADHCLAIKRYLLLGQGDFIQTLLDLVGPDLGERAGMVSGYKLSGALEGAIRATNAQFDDADVLKRLRVKTLPHTGGERGWDVFSLNYVVSSPLSTVFTPVVMEKYLRVFNFLWRLKRVEYALSASWHVMKPNIMATRSRKLDLRSGRGAAGGGGGGGEATPEGHLTLGASLRRCQTLRNEMTHFVTNLQYYLMFEVLECSWADFQIAMSSASGLDELIQAHNLYLETILKKALLLECSAPLATKLTDLFNLCLRFKGFSDRLNEAAQDVENRVSPASRRVKERVDREAATPASIGPTLSHNMAFLRDMAKQLEDIAKDYTHHLDAFLALLQEQKHVDMRFLLFRLDFSEFYTSKLVGGASAHSS